MTEEMKKKLQTTQRRMMKMIIQTKTKSGKCHAAAQTSTSKKKAASTQTATPSFDEVPNDESEDELEPWVDNITRAMRKADDLLVAGGITSWSLQIYWRQARMTAKHREDRWTELFSSWKPYHPSRKGTGKQGRPVKRCEADINAYLQPARTNRDNNDLTKDTTWLTAAEDSLKQQARPTTPITATATTQPTTHDQTTGTAWTHDQNEDDTKDDDEQDDDDTLLILSRLIDI